MIKCAYLLKFKSKFLFSLKFGIQVEKYVVYLWETLRKTISVEASNPQEAHEKVFRAYEAGKISFSMDDFIEDFTDSEVFLYADAINVDHLNEDEIEPLNSI